MMNDEEALLKNRTKAFTLRIIKMFSLLLKSEEARVLGKQVLRSGTSVGANSREAQRARSKAEFIAKIVRSASIPSPSRPSPNNAASWPRWIN